jgi:hypothetical protein
MITFCSRLGKSGGESMARCSSGSGARSLWSQSEVSKGGGSLRVDTFAHNKTGIAH